MKPPLPVDRSRAAIVDAVFENRITLLLGSTGCGKSSRVPQFLLEDLGGGPVLCTQPRRLAVVSIARRVAEERGVPLGGDEVGYRIGQRPHYTSRTAIVFATAGVLLEDLKAHGPAALTRYKVIVLDEVHERSVESDLALACVREFMRDNRRVKLVLMSATCDVEAYSTFFKPVSDGRLARIQITDMSLNLSNLLMSTTVRYMEDAVKLLAGQEDATGTPLPLALNARKPRVAGLAPVAPTPGRTLDWPASGSAASLAPSDDEGGRAAAAAAPGVAPAAMLEYRCILEEAKAEPSKAEGAISPADQRLLRDVVCALHRQDPDLGHAIMVFLPTYRTLELQHELLLATGLPFAVFALHSSIALEDCIAAMELVAGSRRKVVLATNIAESSITIRGIRYVVDSCRTVQLRWDRQAKRMQSSIVYASRSQCDQRKGRTGRTCDGVVYRLLPRRVFLEHLPQFEAPHLTLLHLRRETLGLLCASSPLMSNPLALLRRCMTPPDTAVPSDALLYLASAGAASPAPNACGFQPTPLGHLLGGLPVSVEAAQLLVGGGKVGLLRPAALLAALCCNTPHPIFQPFASAEQYRQNLRRYGGPQAAPGDAQSVLLANLAAFLFWEHAWLDRQRMRRLRQLASGVDEDAQRGAGDSGEAGSGGSRGSGRTNGNKASGEGSTDTPGSILPDADAEEQAWCLRHALIRSSLHSVAETADVLMQALHQHRPDFLLDPANCGPPPHLSAPVSSGARGKIRASQALSGVASHACRLGPAPRQWGANAYGVATEQCVADCARLDAFYDPQAIDKLRQLALCKDVEPGSLAAGGDTNGVASYRTRPVSPMRKVCRFFLTPRGCSYGLDCRFSHDAAAALSPGMLALLRRPVAFPGSAGPRGGPSPSAAGTARLFDFGGGNTVLLLGEGDLSFTEALRGRSGRSGRGTPCIVASVQLGRRELLEAYPGSTLVQRLSRLEAAAAAGRSAAGGPLRLLYGLCATRLHLLGMPGCSATEAGAAGATTAATNRRASSGPSSGGDASSSSSGGGGGDASSGGGSGGGSGSSPFRAGRATHIVFNFPHTGVDEDDDVHRRLMADFFASAGAALLAQGGRAQVLLSLCNDQFSRWHAEAAARAAFFFLEESAPFPLDAFPGYSPARGSGASGFPMECPLTYRFSFCPPAL
ncbi:hypothetical protein ABPG77_004868 [Micractinium sp. CCAP 211/92]